MVTPLQIRFTEDGAFYLLNYLINCGGVGIGRLSRMIALLARQQLFCTSL